MSFVNVHRYNPELLGSVIKVTFVRFDIHVILLSGDVHFTVGSGLPILRHLKFAASPGVLLTVSFTGSLTDGASLK